MPNLLRAIGASLNYGPVEVGDRGDAGLIDARILMRIRDRYREDFRD